MRRLVVSNLNQKEFSSFGVVLNGADAQPRLNFVVPFEDVRSSARANLALIQAPRVALPIVVDMMERHPFSAQAFLPLQDTTYLVIVARSGADGFPDLASAIAYVVPAGLGIAYHPNVWHVGMSAISGTGHFAMMISEAGTPDDCIYQPVELFTVVAS